MDKVQFTEKIEEAIEMVDQARHIVEIALNGTDQEAHFDAYGGYGFTQLLGEGNRYDKSLYDLIDGYEEEVEDE
jgi:hypothetical protein